MSHTEDPAEWEDGTPSTLNSLITENTLLKRKLRVPTEQRILEEVMSREVSSLLREAMRKVDQSENQIGSVHGDGVNVDGNGGTVRETLSEALAALTAEKETTNRRLASVLTDTVAPLQDQVTQLEKERVALRARVEELEMTMANQSPPAFMAELASLRKSESLYRDQLADIQSSEECAAAKVNTLLREGLAAARALPEYTETLEGLREALRGSRAAQEYLTLELEEQASRTALLEGIRNTVASDNQAKLEERAQLLEDQLSKTSAREETLKREKLNLEEQLRALQEENIKLSTQSSSAEETAKAKRQRVDDESAGGNHPLSVRHKFIQFWYEGHETIQGLERKITELEKASADLREAQGRVAQLERSRETTLGQLTSVAQEVNKTREENQKQRAQIAGLEVERDHLLRVVASTVGEQMSATELEDCCRVIREAARTQAAASAAVVTDPEALRQAVRRAQELKNEVAVLQKKKDKLTHYIEIQEDRVATITEKHALLTVGRSSKGATTSSSSGPTHASLAKMTLPQFLESVVSGAKDILWESEAASIGLLDDRSALETAMSRHRDSFVATQGRLHDSQTKLLSSQRNLQEALRDNAAVETRMEQMQSDLNGMMEAKDNAVRTLEKTNAALLQHTSALSGQKRELRRQLDGMTSFADHTLKALGGVFGLFQREVSHVKDLRQLIAQERTEMMQLVQQNSSGSSFDVAAVVEGLRRLEDSIQAAVDENGLQSEDTRMEFLKKLVDILHQQEQQVTTMQKDFMTASQAQAMSVAQRVAAAQKEWESAWKTKCEAAEAQRDQLSAISLSNQVLYNALERAVAKTPETSKLASPPLPSQQPDELSVGPPDSTRDTLAAIDQFVERARQQLSARNAASAPAPPVAPPLQDTPIPSSANSVPAPASPPPPAENEEGEAQEGLADNECVSSAGFKEEEEAAADGGTGNSLQHPAP